MPKFNNIPNNSRLKPCMGCPDRYPACSDHCQKLEFKAYKDEQEKIKENRRKYWSPIWKRGEGRYR